MAYCPHCNREQRCGCEKCHICGGELVERRAAPSGEPARTVAHVGGEPRRGILSYESRAEGSYTFDRETLPSELTPGDRTRSVLPALLLVLGCAILLIALLEVINNALNFPSLGATSDIADGLKHTGYYLGNLLYSSSVRTLTGFALVSTGLLLWPDRPIADRELARKIRLAVGFTMGAIGLLCLLASLLLVLPVGTKNLLLKNMLPTLWVAVCILLVMGAALLIGAYLLVLNTDSSELHGSAIRSNPAPGEQDSSDSEGRGLTRMGGDADRDSRGMSNGSEEGLAGARRSVMKSYRNSVSGSEGDTE